LYLKFDLSDFKILVISVAPQIIYEVFILEWQRNPCIIALEIV